MKEVKRWPAIGIWEEFEFQPQLTFNAWASPWRHEDNCPFLRMCRHKKATPLANADTRHGVIANLSPNTETFIETI